MNRTEWNDKTGLSTGALRLSLRALLESALQEDLGFGDLSGSLFPQSGSGEFLSKESGVLAGSDVIGTAYELLGEEVYVTSLIPDGETIHAGDCIAVAEGPVSQLLAGERVILNLLQHLSGIATAAHQSVEALEGSGIRVCDTRKTIPGLRALQKYAVRCGGGFNHRYRLDDGVMIKDNHIVGAGGIPQAVQLIRERVGLMVKIEVECETIEQVHEAVSSGVDIIMLDNKSPEEVKMMRREIPEQILVEVSGGITPDTIGAYRDSGVDYISIGALTHSVRALDISFNLSGGEKRNRAIWSRNRKDV